MTKEWAKRFCVLLIMVTFAMMVRLVGNRVIAQRGTMVEPNKYSNFLRPDYSQVETKTISSDWLQQMQDEKFCLSLDQTRLELKLAMRKGQAVDLLLQGMTEIASADVLPALQKQTAQHYLRLVGKNWPELAGEGT